MYNFLPLARGSQYAARRFSEVAFTLKVKVIGLVRLTTTGAVKIERQIIHRYLNHALN